MKKIKKSKIGEKIITTEGCESTIIEYKSSSDCTVKFNDGTIKNSVIYSHFKHGKVKNPNHPSVFKKGFLGVGKYNASVDGIQTKAYKTWFSMLRRCYDTLWQKTHITYSECYVSKDWLNFQNFAQWFEENYIEGFDLDKDILIRNNKEYGSSTCCFVPQEVNNLFIKANNIRGDFAIGVHKLKSSGKFMAYSKIDKKRVYLGLFNTSEEAFDIYKTTKEIEIKRVADKWKSIIKPKVHETMYNYSINLTD